MQERHAESRTLTGEVRKQVEFRSKIIRLHSVVDIRTIEPVEHYVTPMAPASDVVASSFIVCLSLRSETVPGAELLGKNFLAEGSAEWFSAESVDGQRACCWQWPCIAQCLASDACRVQTSSNKACQQRARSSRIAAAS